MISKRRLAMAGFAAAGLIASVAAYAVAPAIDPQGVAVANRFYLSGSTALDNAIKHYLSLDITQSGGGICQHGTINIFSDAASLAGATQYMVTCKANVAIGTVVAGGNIMVVKDGKGGSLEGTLPLLHAAFARTYFDVDTGGAGAFLGACAAPVAWNETGAGKPFVHGDNTAAFYGTCGRISAVKTPTNGLADVNAELFNVGLESLSSGDVTALAAAGAPVYQQQFGFAVSLNLYRTLQLAQGRAITDAAADMPSLSTMQLRALFGANGLTGGTLTTDWAQVLDDAGAAVTGHDAANANQTAPVAIAPNGVTAVYICRRGDSSGTSASEDEYLFQNRCQAKGGNVAFVTSATPGATANSAATFATLQATCTGGFIADDAAPGTPYTGGFVAGHTYTMTPQETGCTYVSANNKANLVFAGNGTGDVDKCLHDHSKQNSFAIGILSGDRPYDDLIGGNANPKGGWGGSGDATPAQVSPPQPLNNAASHEWRFIAIDGRKPNLESVASGIYDNVQDNVAYTGALGHAQNANDAAFQTLLVGPSANAMTQSTVLVDIQVSQAHGTTGGILEPLATSVAPIIPINLATTPVSAISKAWNGNNDCQPPIPFNSSSGVALFNRPSDAPAPAGVPAPL